MRRKQKCIYFGDREGKKQIAGGYTPWDLDINKLVYYWLQEAKHNNKYFIGPCGEMFFLLPPACSLKVRATTCHGTQGAGSLT